VKVLLADGDPLFGRIVKSRLEKIGYAVTLASDGDAAWELYQHSPFRFVITEYDLPGVSGPEFCSRVRSLSRGGHTYVLFYATRNDGESIVDAYQAGADDFLAKPFNPVLLDLRLARGKQELTREDDLRMLSSQDDTTGFIKFNTFLRFFTVHEAGARRYNYQGLVTFAAIENFEEILESHGYGIANQTKIIVANALGSSVRSSDLVSHVGDETGDFCILMPDTPKENVGKVIARIESQLQSTAIHAGKEILRPQLSYSTVTYPHEDLHAEQCLAPENREPFKLISAA